LAAWWPACGAALALAWPAGPLAAFDDVLVIVCDGATATVTQWQAWIRGAPDKGLMAALRRLAVLAYCLRGPPMRRRALP
jgi:hypothetical protein